jgi:GNAT superfamily N-acetyltransferase
VGRARGAGVGLAKRLMAVTEAALRELGIKVLRLGTNRALPEAIALYRNSGWTEIERLVC